MLVLLLLQGIAPHLGEASSKCAGNYWRELAAAVTMLTADSVEAMLAFLVVALII